MNFQLKIFEHFWDYFELDIPTKRLVIWSLPENLSENESNCDVMMLLNWHLEDGSLLQEHRQAVKNIAQHDKDGCAFVDMFATGHPVGEIRGNVKFTDFSFFSTWWENFLAGRTRHRAVPPLWVCGINLQSVCQGPPRPGKGLLDRKECARKVKEWQSMLLLDFFLWYNFSLHISYQFVTFKRKHSDILKLFCKEF